MIIRSRLASPGVSRNRSPRAGRRRYGVCERWVETAGYRISRHWTLALGYRAIGLDYDGSAVHLDVVQHGPQIGAVYRWGAGLPDE